ncbi:MAG: nicotinate phosphoribosyltransferase, partial [Limnospira maxima]
VEIDGIPVMKESSSKVTYPGRKQIYRLMEGGKMKGDRLCLMDESESIHPSSIGLLQLVMKDGKLVNQPEPLAAIAERTAASVASLPPECRRFDHPIFPSLEISEELANLRQKVSKSIEVK